MERASPGVWRSSAVGAEAVALAGRVRQPRIPPKAWPRTTGAGISALANIATASMAPKFDAALPKSHKIEHQLS